MSSEQTIVASFNRSDSLAPTFVVEEGNTVNLYLIGGFDGETEQDLRQEIILKNDSTVNVFGLFVVREHSKFVTHLSITHEGRNAKSSTIMRGAAFEHGVLNVIGTVNIPRSGHLASAFLDERVLLMGEDARADAVPNLEILANDVQAKHAAAIGKISEEEVFYLMTRGLTKTEAERLALEGFFGEYLAKIEDREAREYFLAHVG
ncbi:MAG: SufD family Fe-S cluster assembly protein [Candidatus Kerfeldbacteria bacterium]|nr:SufD family Fe-S cluster assembly protein [Candidatus Kerfeldbacteria bacterium]